MNDEDPVYFYIDNRGKTTIHCILKEPKEISVLETQLTNSLSALFETVKTILQPLGYHAPIFNGFQDSEIHNINIQYTFSIALDNRIKFDGEHYLQSVFDVENTNIFLLQL